jgi:hypothetical protein
MIVNYCVGHDDSTMLMCPHLTSVSLINHSQDPTKTNAKLQLSSSQYTNQTLWETSAHELLERDHATRSFGIVFDVVATRDILADEEIYVNYGPSWQQAWDDHKQARSPFVHDLLVPTNMEDTGHVAIEIDTLVDECIADYSSDDADNPSDVPKCLKSMIFEILQQSPEERHTLVRPRQDATIILTGVPKLSWTMTTQWISKKTQYFGTSSTDIKLIHGNLKY